MKALIFNSGIGARMGHLTKEAPKCMAELYNGETIFERQIRILSGCGITEFIVTTGFCKEQLKEASQKYSHLKFTFINNPDYRTTNYIVSMDYAYDMLDDDILMLHGDLVFNKNLVPKLLSDPHESVCLFNENKELPSKDFKGRFKDKILKEVSINIFDSDCYAFQPLYKLGKSAITAWKNKVREFVNNGITTVYAENALNEISDEISIYGLSYKDDYIDEIDNEQDYIRVSNEIKYLDYREQTIEESSDYISCIKKHIDKKSPSFVVCTRSLKEKASEDFKSIGVDAVFFSDYSPNPKYEDVKKGACLFKKSGCKTIVSIGGGSAIDVAKCIKLFATLDNEYDFLNGKYNYNNIYHIAVPTTCGTGSESTSFAVIYYNGQKLSIEHGSVLPDVAILDHSFLASLPEYQRNSTLSDSLCQAIESYWAANANDESRHYSARCIEMILANLESFLCGDIAASKNILRASNYSGKAINISKTTAPHAMSYKLTSLYKIAHGHAVALCLIPCWKLLKEKAKTDKKLEETLLSLASVLTKSGIDESISYVSDIIKKLNLPAVTINADDLNTLADSVNTSRLNNNPVIFDKSELYNIYKSIAQDCCDS